MEPDKARRQLVDYLLSGGYILSRRVQEAFESVPREKFVPEEYENKSYNDIPLPIGEGQTISAPSMIAIMLEVSDLVPGLRVLEIGTGSGYNACLIANIVGDGFVTSIERIESLFLRTRQIIENCGQKVITILGDGTLGWEKGAPYDRIIITAAAPNFPQPLIQQLACGGKIIAPVGARSGLQMLTVGTKLKDGSLSTNVYCACAFVPLLGTHGF